MFIKVRFLGGRATERNKVPAMGSKSDVAHLAEDRRESFKAEVYRLRREDGEMTATVSTFALIGRAFPSDSFRDLHQASITARAERRGRRIDHVLHMWANVRYPIVLPKRLSA